MRQGHARHTALVSWEKRITESYDDIHDTFDRACKRWHIDTVLRVLTLAGNHVREEILSSFIRLVAHTPELQAYTTSKLYSALQADVSQESLTLASVWLIGEYSEILMQSGVVHEEQAKAVCS